jgi:hypothetical protein
MNKEQLEKKEAELIEKFEQVKKVAGQTDANIQELNRKNAEYQAEMLRIQGEFRLLQELKQEDAKIEV